MTAPTPTPRKDYKVAIVGGGGVGKSAITIQYVQNIFVTEYDPTIEDSYKKLVVIDDEPVVLDILDTAGQEDYSSLRDHYMRKGEAFVLVYSITDRKSFEEAARMKLQIHRAKDTEIFPMVLVGNKCDLTKEREVMIDEGKEISKQYQCPFIEASAKARINVDEIFTSVVREMRKFYVTEEPKEKPSAFKSFFKKCIII